MNNEFYDTVILSQIAKQKDNINPWDEVIFNIDDFSKTSDDDK